MQLLNHFFYLVVQYISREKILPLQSRLWKYIVYFKSVRLETRIPVSIFLSAVSFNGRTTKNNSRQ